jgi:o-succinylbenzoate synthase
MSFLSIATRRIETAWNWPLQQGGEVPTRRIGWIIEAIDTEGFSHQAELSPCPGVHPETAEEAHEVFRSIQKSLLQKDFTERPWQWTTAFFNLLMPESSLPTSVQTAVEQLLLSWSQRRQPDECSLPGPMQIQGSALLALTSWDDFTRLWDQGFRIFKCKVGRQAPADELAFLQRMTAFAGPALRLRLDANRHMTAEQWELWENASQSLPIQYWEEGPSTVGGLAALDETLWEARHPEDHPARVWILKPTRLTLSRSIALMKKAAATQRLCVLSNAFDSGLSLRCAAWLYAAFCTEPQPLGYGTARYLPNDVWHSEAWGRATVVIPQRPFAGVEGEV